MSSNRHAVWQVLELIHGDGDQPSDLQLDFFEALAQLDLWPTRWIPQPTCIASPESVELASVEALQVGLCERSNNLLCVTGTRRFVAFCGPAYGQCWDCLDEGVDGHCVPWGFLFEDSATIAECRGPCRPVPASLASACHVGSNCTQSTTGTATTGDFK